MTNRDEVKPPKINQESSVSNEETKKLLDIVKLRVSEIGKNCDGIHFTDSVLGIPRVSPVTTGKIIRKSNEISLVFVFTFLFSKLIDIISSLMKSISFFCNSFNDPVEFSKVRVPFMIHNFANPTINQSFLSITVIFTCDDDNVFLNSFAAESPPKPPPKITTCGIFVNLKCLSCRSY